MRGAINEAMALTNCPKVSCEARFLPPLTSAISGLSDVCIRVLPMPRSEKATNISGKLLPNMGNNSERAVTTIESSTVFFFPILFISTLVGTLKMRNQKNTSEGSTLATVSLSPCSSFT